jgi:RNA polymerase sigma factor (sigma-70 family)
MLERLLAEYDSALWRLVNSYAADPAAREDLFQEIALGLWKAIPCFRAESSERTWLYRIAHNIAITTLDSRLRREKTERPIPETVQWRAHNVPADEELAGRERADRLMSAVRELPAIDRQVVTLHLEGLSHLEIEAVSGLSENAIATRLSRIRARLSQTVRQKENRA